MRPLLKGPYWGCAGVLDSRARWRVSPARFGGPIGIPRFRPLILVCTIVHLGAGVASSQRDVALTGASRVQNTQQFNKPGPLAQRPS